MPFSNSLPRQWPQAVPSGMKDDASLAYQELDPSRGEGLFHVGDGRRVEQRLAAFLAEEGGQGHAPVALARDAPVGAVLDHAGDALLSPGRQPLDAMDGGEGVGAQARVVHGDEPLRRGAVDDRLLAAPAMGVGVADGARVQQAAVLPQVLHDPFVGLEHLQPLVGADGLVEAPAGVDRRIDVEPVRHPGVIVVLAVAGRGMHAAGALVEQDVVGVDQQRVAVEERVAGLEPVQLPALEFQQLAERVAVQGGDGGQQGGGGDIQLALHFEQGVIEVRVQGDGQVRRYGPGGGGPDQDRHRAAG